MGTIFINTLGNLLSTMAVGANILIETLNDAVISYPNQQPVKKLLIKCADIKFGQSRDFAFVMENLPNDRSVPILNAKLVYYDYSHQELF